MKSLFVTIASVMLLASCGERDQALGAGPSHGDTPLWEGSQSGYMASGWSAGDQASWKKQIQTRNQAQNEYNRVN